MSAVDQPEQASCAECGAVRVDGMDCWWQLGAILAWEWQDPELAAEHFLTVATYNLQHPAQFTAEAIAGLRTAFAGYLDGAMTIADIRGAIGQVANGSQRVLRPEAERVPVLRHWQMTIADVYIPDRPEGAAVRVRAWAQSVKHGLGRT